MSDRFASFQPSQSGPAASAFAITPSDATELAEPTRGIYVGQGGDISVIMLAGEAVVLRSVAAGSILPLRVRRVQATGTTASHLVGLL
ncbi:hypothetical protein [Rhizobium sp. RU36D]|uniref:spike base protein, RCAP_Rcc01079 family n=1 Tax=Rhizobium sp. RU36D TaxID=1907415 RepID=UPI0009D883DF|nr:hypothetical protein [Rhizobium sp. RU36D]SMD17129.1 hypothetical protein SAMN05880593_13159 [Rhizobium sp. RU36D]